MTDITNDSIENLFTYHESNEEQIRSYIEIRHNAKELAYVINRVCPVGPDRTDAIRKLREVVMTANSAIATGGGFYR